MAPWILPSNAVPSSLRATFPCSPAPGTDTESSTIRTRPLLLRALAAKLKGESGVPALRLFDRTCPVALARHCRDWPLGQVRFNCPSATCDNSDFQPRAEATWVKST